MREKLFKNETQLHQRSRVRGGKSCDMKVPSKVDLVDFMADAQAGRDLGPQDVLKYPLSKASHEQKR